MINLNMTIVKERRSALTNDPFPLTKLCFVQNVHNESE